MPYLQLENRQYPLLEGETRVGGSQTADVRLDAGPGEGSIDAVITVEPDHSASVRRLATEASIDINGTSLGTQPTPLFHGDRLEINGIALVYGDEAQAGATRQVVVDGRQSSSPAPPRPGRRPRSGGRIVSLTDGREYTVRADGLTLGREAGCDIVIAAAEVSRRHARIELRPDGYVLLDTSTNGILVNGSRIIGSHALATRDILRIGPEEFRFHADLAPVSAETWSPPPPPAPPSPVAPPSVAGPPRPAPAVPPLGEALPAPAANSPGTEGEGTPATSPPAAPDAGPPQPPAATVPGPASRRPALAVLEIINEGPTKGTRFEVVDSLTHVGRGAHNEIVIADESVSDSHAKLQRREQGWFVVDMGSTNGSYVNGTRVSGDAPLAPDAELRFGGVKLRFEPAAVTADAGGGTRVIVKYRAPTPSSADAVEDAPRASTDEDDEGAPEPLPRALVAAVLVLAAAVIYLILRTLV